MTTCTSQRAPFAVHTGGAAEKPSDNSVDWRALLSHASIEVLPEQATTFALAANAFAPGAYVFLPHIAGHSLDVRVVAAKHLIARGLHPVVHLSARNFPSIAEFEGHIRDLDRAGVKCCLAIGGVPSITPNPVLATATDMIESSAFRAASFETVFVAGHPEGIAGVADQELWAALGEKLSLLRSQNRRTEIVTQFAFDGDAMARWANLLRCQEINVPLRFGVAGVTSLPKLIKFAVLCGVGPSLSILKRQAGSIFKVMRDQDPREIIEALSNGLAQNGHANTHIHFFPFGGWEKTATWMSLNAHAGRACAD